MRTKILLASAAALMLASCARPMPLSPAFNQMRSPMMNRASAPMTRFGAVRRDNVLPLVGVEGIATGDNLRVKGPFFTSGKGKVHNFTPDAFKIQFQIVNHHLIVDATRIDAEKIKFVTVDLNAGRTVEAIGTYKRTGSTTVFDMGPGAEVEKMTVRAIKPGNFEVDVVQPGRLFPPADERGSNTLKFFKE